MNDELRERRVERLFLERQLLRRGLSTVDSRMALPRCRDERLGRIDGSHRVRVEPPDQLGCQRARAAADVERALPGADACERRELGSQRHRVAPHEAVVCVGGDFEAREGYLRLSRRPRIS